jgi:hypothetical protein
MPRIVERFPYRLKYEVVIERTLVEGQDNTIGLAFNASVNLSDISSSIEHCSEARVREMLEAEIETLSQSKFADTLKLLVEEIAETASYGSDKFQIDRKAEIEKSKKTYEKALRGLVPARRGRPTAEDEFNRNRHDFQEAAGKFVLELIVASVNIGVTGKRITKSAIAETIFPNNSNPLQALNRMFDRFGYSQESKDEMFETILKPIEH